MTGRKPLFADMIAKHEGLRDELRLQDLIANEMADYLDGAYADHSSAKDQLTRFAALVLEEAAKVCDDKQIIYMELGTDPRSAYEAATIDCADAIRAMKPKE